MDREEIWERAEQLAIKYHDTELEYLPEKLRETLCAMAERELNGELWE